MRHLTTKCVRSDGFHPDLGTDGYRDSLQAMNKDGGLALEPSFSLPKVPVAPHTSSIMIVPNTSSGCSGNPCQHRRDRWLRGSRHTAV